MKEGFIIFVVVGVVGGYLLMSFLGKIQKTDKLSTAESRQEAADLTHYKKDAVGNTVLMFNPEDSYEQKLQVWKRSPLHEQFLDYYPNFRSMKGFAKDRIVDDTFREQLLKRIDGIESEFFSGTISNLEAREKLQKL